MLDYKELVKARKREEKRARRRYKITRNKRKYKKWRIAGMVTIVILVISIGVYLSQNDKSQIQIKKSGDLVIQKQGEMVVKEEPKKEINSNHEDSAKTTIQLSEQQIQEEVSKQLEEMSIERQVAQLLITSPEALTGIGIAVQAGDTTKMRLKQYPIGGMTYTEKNFEVIEQITTMLENIQLYSNIPLFLIMNELGAERIENTNHSLYEVGINMQQVEDEIYMISENDSKPVKDSLTIVKLDGKSGSELLSNEADMIIIEDDFFTTYKNLVNEVSKDSELAGIIQGKVKKVMSYKLKQQIQ